MDTLLDRFCRYVKVETTSVEETDQYPSSPGQLDLGKLLAEEMRTLGLEEVSVSEHGIVMGTIPGNIDGAPTIAWLAHQDTSPEAPGKDVKPIVHKERVLNRAQPITLARHKALIIPLVDSVVG